MESNAELDWEKNPFRRSGFSELRAKVGAFLHRHPYDTNVFVMMRYHENERFRDIEQTIRGSLSAHGLEAHLAKDRAFSDDLWENVRIYMHACNYGIAIFEQIHEKDFNPNISLELGYMYAWGKRCLLLKDGSMQKLPTDMCGKLYKDFDTDNIRSSLSARIDEWVRDLGAPWKTLAQYTAARQALLKIALDDPQIKRIVSIAVDKLRESGYDTNSLLDIEI